MVPIDFGARLGGDEIPRFVRAASRGGNPYAAALEASLLSDPSKMQTLRAGASIVHAYAEPNTVFHGISVKSHSPSNQHPTTRIPRRPVEAEASGDRDGAV